jgi:hypothetical protein
MLLHLLGNVKALWFTILGQRHAWTIVDMDIHIVDKNKPSNNAVICPWLLQMDKTFKCKWTYRNLVNLER